MDTKTLVTIGVVILLLVGLIWLGALLPGLGFGLGGKGPGEGGSSGTAEAPPQPAPAVGTEEEVVVSGDKAVLKWNNQSVTSQQLADWAKAGRRFVVKDQGDAQRKIMEEFRAAAANSEGRIVVKE